MKNSIKKFIMKFIKKHINCAATLYGNFERTLECIVRTVILTIGNIMLVGGVYIRAIDTVFQLDGVFGDYGVFSDFVGVMIGLAFIGAIWATFIIIGVIVTGAVFALSCKLTDDASQLESSMKIFKEVK